jgi:23S rRNA (pseudouridine1915-N3)-methyltransferase
MKIIVLSIGNTLPDWLEQLSKEFDAKISRLNPYERLHIKSKTQPRDQKIEKQRNDSEKILNSLRDDDHVILCDERGKDLDSIQFSKLLNRAQLSGKKRWVFVIGGAFGVSEELMKRADQSVSLSKLVFNHLIASAILQEQIYRGFCILQNRPYHNE